MIGCTCTECQLDTVGCECVETAVTYWPKGYADEAGPKVVIMSHNALFTTEVKRLAGYSAKVADVREYKRAPKPHYYSAEYVSEMSIGG